MKNILKKGCGGFAIVTVVFVLLVFAFIGLTMATLIGTGSQSLTDELLSNQAFHVADGGLSYIAEQLENDPDWSNITGETKNFGAGSFTITFTAQTSTTATVRSAGTVGGVTSTLQRDFVKGGGGPKAFQSATYAGTSVVVSGSAAGDVYGPVSAGTSVTMGSNVIFHDTVEFPNPDAAVPTADMTYWYNNATTRYTSNRTFTAGTYTGIIYVAGSCTLRSNVVINGTIVCTVDIGASSQNNITGTPPASRPILLAGRDFTFNNTRGVNINGYIMAVRNANAVGNSNITVNGGITAGTTVTFGGSANINVTYNSARSPSMDGFVAGTGEPGGGFTESNWQEIF